MSPQTVFILAIKVNITEHVSLMHSVIQILIIHVYYTGVGGRGLNINNIAPIYANKIERQHVIFRSTYFLCTKNIKSTSTISNKTLNRNRSKHQSQVVFI